MNREEILELIKDNLRIKFETYDDSIHVTLELNEEVIDSGWIDIPQNNRGQSVDGY